VYCNVLRLPCPQSGHAKKSQQKRFTGALDSGMRAGQSSGQASQSRHTDTSPCARRASRWEVYTYRDEAAREIRDETE